MTQPLSSLTVRTPCVYESPPWERNDAHQSRACLSHRGGFMLRSEAEGVECSIVRTARKSAAEVFDVA